ncbi:BTB and MATH domain-containing protein 43 [Orchesella cincta]|uniref:BTB and MATH domain-containing protein 43 n=1 Tax=Orchesella cincta TaxID=48709 RepID=A0A1D2M2Z3_ORCCI|nr:BTB and MATH domain-containing protein 43 [Orchesella cincta]
MASGFTLKLVHERHPISFTKPANANHPEAEDDERSDTVLEGGMDRVLEIRSTTDLVNDLETQKNRAAIPLIDDVYENMTEALKTVLARRSEIQNDTISVSVRYIYHPHVPFGEEGRCKAEVRLSGPFLRSIFTEYKGPLMIYLWFTFNDLSKRPNPCFMWVYNPEFTPSITNEGEYVFESCSSRVQESKRVIEDFEYRGHFVINLFAPKLTGGLTCGLLWPNSNILDQENQRDFELIAKNGKRFRCHKAVLAAKSAVLARMLESNCEETRGNAYRLDLCEDGVGDLIAFIYNVNTTKPMRTSQTFWEMFEVADKFQIEWMGEAIESLFLKQTYEWMDIGVAVKLFVHTLKVEGNGQLKWKAIKVIKSKPNELMSSATFDQLWRNDPDTAKEIFRLGMMMAIG